MAAWNRRELVGAIGIAAGAAAGTATGTAATPGPSARSGGAAQPVAPGPAAAGPPTTIRRGYVDGPWGQVHYRRAEPPAALRGRHPPLVMFHQNPRSSFEYEPLMRLMAQDRLCIALDTPGYGGSDPPPQPPGIPGYATALIRALEQIGFGDVRGGALDVFGFHTGTFLAAEVAVQRPALVKRLALAGVPHTIGEERRRYYDSLVTNRRPRPMSGSHLVEDWYTNVLQRPAPMSIERAEQMVLENRRAGDRYWWAYEGVFSYDSEARLREVRQPVLLMAVDDSLLVNTRAARSLLPDAVLLEMPDVEGMFMLDGWAPVFAKAIREFLS